MEPQLFSSLIEIEGPIFWRSRDGDIPIHILDIVQLECGELYATIEGSLTGIPLTEIVYGEQI